MIVRKVVNRGYISLTAFVIMTTAMAWLLSSWNLQMLHEENRQSVGRVMSGHATSLSTAVAKRYSLVAALRALVESTERTEDIGTFFNRAAAALFETEQGLRMFGLAPDGVTQHIYPLAGNEAALGSRLLTDPDPNRGGKAQEAVIENKITLSDPFQLRQGGLAVVYRTPVYREGRFWGLAFVGSDMTRLLQEAKMFEAEKQFHIAIRDSRGNVFYGQDSVFEQNPVIVPLDLLTGNQWEIAAVPQSGWRGSTQEFYARLLIWGLWLVSNCIAYFIWYEKQILATLVKQRTIELGKRAAELRESQFRYSTLVQQSYDAILVFDLRTHKIIEANDRFFLLTEWNYKDVANWFVYDLLASKDRYYMLRNKLEHDGELDMQQIQFKRKDGWLFEVEVTAKVIDWKGVKLAMVNARDISERVKQEAIHAEEARIAGQVQKVLLPPDLIEKQVAIKSIHVPLRLVGGDTFDYFWLEEGRRLFGYIADITGHGAVAALQTSSIKILFHQICHQDLPLLDRVELVNEQALAYFPEECFAAVFAFEINFERNVMECVSGGINTYLHIRNAVVSRMQVPGCFLGIFEKPDFGYQKVAFLPGDCFLFMTDGLQGNLPANLAGSCREIRHQIKETLDVTRLKDDATAVTIEMKSEEIAVKV